MKKLFDIPIYGLSPLKLDDHVSRFVAKLKSQLLHLEEDTFSCIKDIETFPMRSWNYNHIVGYIRVEMSDTDMLFDVFLPIPIPERYNWRTKRKVCVQDICANGTHFYFGTLKTNEEIRAAMVDMLNQVVADHIPKRFHVDRDSFDILNKHLDYIGIIEIEYEEK